MQANTFYNDAESIIISYKLRSTTPCCMFKQNIQKIFDCWQIQPRPLSQPKMSI